MRIILLLLSLLLSFSANAQDEVDKKSFVILFYNVENLFDTINNPNTADDEFLPDGKKQWNSERYHKKLDDLAKVMSALHGKNLPAIIGVSEIENRQVVEDLAATNQLKKGKYQVVHKQSPDKRGIDVALMYSKKKFKYLSHQNIGIRFEQDPKLTTRDILYVKGLTKKEKDTLHVFVNHWSSRRGGQEASEWKRIAAARVLDYAVDSINAVNPKAKIVIMGDFNDHPDNKSVAGTLGAKPKPETGYELLNLLYDEHEAGLGTYNYRGDWGVLDQIIVSDDLINANKGWGTSPDGGEILKKDWMLYYNEKHDYYTPNRTYGGPNYYGGYSDHLPVYLELKR